MNIEAKMATPHEELIAELLDSRIPKTEREHAAAREVEKLRQAIAEAEEQESVAWRTFDGEGNYEYCTYEMNENYAKEWAKRNPNHADWVDPLYAHPPTRKPVAWLSQGGDVSRSKKHFEEMGFTNLIALYMHPPARKPLTDEQISAIVQSMSAYTWDAHMLARAIERAHGIGE
jgi:hypothetical protein